MSELTKAEQIRAAHADGLTTGQIAEKVGVSYQHAYNTLRMAGLVVKKVENDGDSKAAQMRALRAQGLEYGEIAKVMGVRYQWVHNVLGKRK